MAYILLYSKQKTERIKTMDRKLETKIVKKALKEIGINASVSHDTGTAWGWLRIEIEETKGNHVHDMRNDDLRYNCPACKKDHELCNQALLLALKVTGRTGDYDGRINVSVR